MHAKQRLRIWLSTSPRDLLPSYEHIDEANSYPQIQGEETMNRFRI